MEDDETFRETCVFEDRTDAGRQLAALLTPYQSENPIILALPRGGVVIGYEVAQALHAPLDVMVARKLGAPGHEELGIGAVAPGGVRVLDDFAVRALSIRQEDLDRITTAETREMERRLHLYRGDRPEPDVLGKTVILVDDGLATGVTARAAILSLRQQRPRHLLLAVPVCAPETARALLAEADDILCVCAPPNFRAVGLWYRDFEQVSDEEVITLLERAGAERIRR